MSEIEKMYARAMIKPLSITVCGVDEQIINYPPFTTKKQLELIKWVAETQEECTITYEKKDKWGTQTYWEASYCFDNFSESLANLINNLWQDLTPEEKQQVKGILE